MSKIAIVEVEYQVVVRHEVRLPEDVDIEDVEDVFSSVIDAIDEMSFDEGVVQDSERIFEPEIISVEEIGD